MQPQGLTKAAAMIALVAALATILAVHVPPPAAENSRRSRSHAGRAHRILVPATIPRGGTGSAQGRGAAVERREAGGRRATNHSGNGPL